MDEVGWAKLTGPEICAVAAQKKGVNAVFVASDAA